MLFTKNTWHIEKILLLIITYLDNTNISLIIVVHWIKGDSFHPFLDRICNMWDHYKEEKAMFVDL